MCQQCNHTDPANCPTCTLQAPFKKGDWIVIAEELPGAGGNLRLPLQADHDPIRDQSCASCWGYKYDSGVSYDAPWFTKATKADLMKEHARLHGELDALQARMNELLSAAEGLS